MTTARSGLETAIYDEQGHLTYEAMLQLYGRSLSPMRLVDRDFNLVLQNPAMESLTRFPTPEISGKKCYEVARSAESCHTDQCPLRQILGGRQRVEQYYSCELWDGREFPAWVLATPFFDGDGEVAGCLQVIRDETHILGLSNTIEEKNRELADNLDRLQGYTEIVQTLNRETRLENLADKALTLLARHTPVVMGVMYRYDEDAEQLVPLAAYALDGPASSFRLGQGLAGEAALTGDPIFLDKVPENYFRFRSGTGEARPSHIACLPISAADVFIGILELAALDSLDQERSFLENVRQQLGIAMHHALMLKKSSELAAELKIRNQRLEQQNEELKAQSEELIAQSEEIQSQAEELTAQRDALEQKTMEADEANRMKSIFLSNMSHELRTPLNAILGLARLMRDAAAGEVNDKQEQYLDVILRNGRTLLDLINDILDLTRIETGREEIRFDTIQVRGFLEGLTTNIRPLAERKDLVFRLETAAGPDTMVADERKLSRILTNLLSNAIKFTDQGKVVLKTGLESGEEHDFVRFSVSDTGIGISPEDMETIFEPFRQINGGLTRKHGGSGLGLSICQKLAVMLGGKISVDSAPGEGSTFSLVLPRDRRGKLRVPEGEWKENMRRLLLPETKPREPARSFPRAAATPAPETDRDSAGEPRGPRILLVEDDMIAVRELGVHLREAGYSVSFSLDGLTGLNILREKQPDLIVLDLVMPIMDGFGFLEELQRLTPEAAAVPVVILSARDLEPEETRRLPSQVKEVLRKGDILPEQLLSALKGILEPAPSAGEEAVEANTKAGETPTRGRGGRPRPGGRRILVAEDNPDNLFFIKEILGQKGYEIHGAGNGAEAVRLARGERPDLILMDIQMPDVSGFQAVQTIRDTPEIEDVPTIALTAKAMKGDRESIMAKGFDGYISKPVKPAALLEMVEKWLKGKNGGEQDSDRQ